MIQLMSNITKRLRDETIYATLCMILVLIGLRHDTLLVYDSRVGPICTFFFEKSMSTRSLEIGGHMHLNDYNIHIL